MFVEEERDFGPEGEVLGRGWREGVGEGEGGFRGSYVGVNFGFGYQERVFGRAGAGAFGERGTSRCGGETHKRVL